MNELLGDRISRKLKQIGFKECGGCKKRREFLNKLDQQLGLSKRVIEVYDKTKKAAIK